jgi:hypothetical protein
MSILNFGSCNIDYVYSLDHIVKDGETESTDCLEIFSGGKGLNQSIALARAGANVFHAGCIGEDGEFLLEMLKNSGVDVSEMMKVPSKNGHAIIQVSKEGENSIFLYPGSNVMMTEKYVENVLAHFSENDTVLLQNETNLVPFIIACAIPAKQDPFQTYPPGELERLLAGQKTGETGQSQFSNEDYVKKTVAAGGWQCSCGRANPAYSSTCACGLNKRQSDPSVGYAAKAAERTRQQQALDAELKKYQVMLDSQIITQEQYEAKVRELFNKR